MVRVAGPILLAVLLACGGESADGHGPDPLATVLRVGVEPRAEAEAVRRGLEAAGWELVRRVAAERFVAMSFARPQTGGSILRVVTRRGLAFALEVPASEAGQPLWLMDVHSGEELVIGRADPVLDRTCLAVLRVDEDGRIGEVPISLEEGACIEAVDDLGPPPGLEALVVRRMPELSRGGRTPAVVVPHVLDAGRYVPATEGFEAHWAAERAGRERALAEARAGRDVAQAYVLAIELAAIERGRGRPLAVQVAAFDEALSGLVLGEREARAVREARAIIARWQR